MMLAPNRRFETPPLLFTCPGKSAITGCPPPVEVVVDVGGGFVPVVLVVGGGTGCPPDPVVLGGGKGPVFLLGGTSGPVGCLRGPVFPSGPLFFLVHRRLVEQRPLYPRRREKLALLQLQNSSWCCCSIRGGNMHAYDSQTIGQACGDQGNGIGVEWLSTDNFSA